MYRHHTVSVAITIAALLTSCNEEIARGDAGAADTGGSPTGSETSTDTPSTTITTTTTHTTLDTSDEATTSIESFDGSDTTVAGTGTVDPSTDSGTTEAPDAEETTDEDTGEAPFGTLPHEESFEAPDGSLWPAPWTEAGTAVLSATIDHGQGRLVGETGRVARMVLPGFTESDVDVVVTVRFDDWQQQGFGLYVRQNGGALQETVPHGQGYAAYVEGGWMQSIGIWRETDGVEELLVGAEVPGGALAPGVPYRLRLQCFQQDASTLLRTRLWPLGEPEPEAWQVELLDDTPVLQGALGSFALDLYNYSGNGGVQVDDLLAEPL